MVDRGDVDRHFLWTLPCCLIDRFRPNKYLEYILCINVICVLKVGHDFDTSSQVKSTMEHCMSVCLRACTIELYTRHYRCQSWIANNLISVISTVSGFAMLSFYFDSILQTTDDTEQYCVVPDNCLSFHTSFHSLKSDEFHPQTLDCFWKMKTCMTCGYWWLIYYRI